MAKDFMVSWLKDAYAMERSIEKTLEAHSKDAEEFPEVQARIDQHLDETRRHAELIEDNLELMDESPSMFKSISGNVMGALQGSAMTSAEDSIVKNAIAEYGTEHFEIASYRALRYFAEMTGHEHIVTMCDEILKDEEEMALYLENAMPNILEDFADDTSVIEASRMEPTFGERIERRDDE